MAAEAIFADHGSEARAAQAPRVAFSTVSGCTEDDVNRLFQRLISSVSLVNMLQSDIVRTEQQWRNMISSVSRRLESIMLDAKACANRDPSYQRAIAIRKAIAASTVDDIDMINVFLETINKSFPIIEYTISILQNSRNESTRRYGDSISRLLTMASNKQVDNLTRMMSRMSYVAPAAESRLTVGQADSGHAEAVIQPKRISVSVGLDNMNTLLDALAGGAIEPRRHVRLGARHLGMSYGRPDRIKHPRMTDEKMTIQQFVHKIASQNTLYASIDREQVDQRIDRFMSSRWEPSNFIKSFETFAYVHKARYDNRENIIKVLFIFQMCARKLALLSDITFNTFDSPRRVRNRIHMVSNMRKICDQLREHYRGDTRVTSKVLDKIEEKTNLALSGSYEFLRNFIFDMIALCNESEGYVYFLKNFMIVADQFNEFFYQENR